jgi:hypothetical protein
VKPSGARRGRRLRNRSVTSWMLGITCEQGSNRDGGGGRSRQRRLDPQLAGTRVGQRPAASDDTVASEGNEWRRNHECPCMHLRDEI